jgi:hypothetical protein
MSMYQQQPVMRCCVEGCINFAKQFGCQNNCITVCNYHSAGIVGDKLIWLPGAVCFRCNYYVYPEYIRKNQEDDIELLRQQMSQLGQ